MNGERNVQELSAASISRAGRASRGADGARLGKKRSDVMVDVAGVSSHGGLGIEDPGNSSKEEPRSYGATQPIRSKTNHGGRRLGSMAGIGSKKSQPLMQGRLRPGHNGTSPQRGSPPSSQSRSRPNAANKFKTTSSQFNLHSKGGRG